MTLYGLGILVVNAPEAQRTDYERIDTEYVMGLSSRQKEQWSEAFNRQKGGLPQEWVGKVDPE